MYLYVLAFRYSQSLDTDEVTYMVMPQRHCLVHLVAEIPVFSVQEFFGSRYLHVVLPI